MVQKQWLPKPALPVPVAVKRVATVAVAKPVVKQQKKAAVVSKDEQIAILESQLAALKALKTPMADDFEMSVSTSQKKVS
jgi:hypothetical protein